MLLGLRHRAIGTRHHQDGSVHLCSTSDHVLHIIGVARAVDVSVMPVRCLVLHMGGVDGDTAGTLLRGSVDLVIPDKEVLPKSIRWDSNTVRPLRARDLVSQG